MTEFGTNIGCPRKGGCEGKVIAIEYSIDPLFYTFRCTACKIKGNWDDLVRVKGKLRKNFATAHSYPKSSKDRLKAALEQKRMMEESYDN